MSVFWTFIHSTDYKILSLVRKIGPPPPVRKLLPYIFTFNLKYSLLHSIMHLFVNGCLTVQEDEGESGGPIDIVLKTFFLKLVIMLPGQLQSIIKISKFNINLISGDKVNHEIFKVEVPQNNLFRVKVVNNVEKLMHNMLDLILLQLGLLLHKIISNVSLLEILSHDVYVIVVPKKAEELTNIRMRYCLQYNNLIRNIHEQFIIFI